MLWKAPEGVRAGAAGIDHRRNPGPDTAHVRVNAGLVHAFVDVTVEVDQPGDDKLARDIDDAARTGGVDGCGHLGDGAALDGYVEISVQSLARVEDPAALQE